MELTLVEGGLLWISSQSESVILSLPCRVVRSDILKQFVSTVIITAAHQPCLDRRSSNVLQGRNKEVQVVDLRDLADEFW